MYKLYIRLYTIKRLFINELSTDQDRLCITEISPQTTKKKPVQAPQHTVPICMMRYSKTSFSISDLFFTRVL